MKYFHISKNSLDLELNLQILINRHMKKLMYLPLFALFVACAAPAEEVTAVDEAPVEEEAVEADSTAMEADSTAVETDSTAAEAAEDHSDHDHDAEH